jgi:hypothetical protein
MSFSKIDNTVSKNIKKHAPIRSCLIAQNILDAPSTVALGNAILFYFYSASSL